MVRSEFGRANLLGDRIGILSLVSDSVWFELRGR